MIPNDWWSRAGSIVAVVLGVACTKVVEVPIAEGPTRLVIEGRLELRRGDASGAQRVRLTTSDRATKPAAPPPATGAAVRVTDDAGGAWIFRESATEPGTYLGTGLVPAIGRQYTLTIDYQGERYQGTHQLLAVAPIDSLYFEYVKKGIAQGDSGFRAVIDYSDPAGVRNYYLWDLLVDGQPRIAPDPGNRFRVISEDKFYDGGRVVGFQPYDEEVVETGQRVAIRQIALSEAGYRYYFALFEQTTGGGGPFSVPPASVRGNMANLTNRDHFPLGFFLAGEVAERTAIVPPRPTGG